MRARRVVLCLALTVAAGACATAGGHGGPADARPGDDVDAPEPDAPAPDASDIDAPDRADAPPGTPDASPDAASPDAAIADASPPDAMITGATTSLLLSEIELAPTGGEFIEIVNPTAQSVALDHYYLTDNGNYWKLPSGAQTLDTGDFIITFKAGSSIAAHGVVTVALDTAANFKTAHNNTAPTYSVADATVTVVASSGTPGLTNTGEIVVLFYWDGATDLVTDIDIMLAGKPTVANGLVSKSGQTVKSSTYKTDADTIANQAATPGSGGVSTKRMLLETGHETQNGAGNGVGGDDETSEQTGTTWDSSAFSPATPGAVPAALLP